MYYFKFIIIFTYTIHSLLFFFFFFFNDTATTEIYTLSLHDALPIYSGGSRPTHRANRAYSRGKRATSCSDRKSTRLNSSHSQISYAVFCLKKKKKKKKNSTYKTRNTTKHTLYTEHDDINSRAALHDH